MARATVPWDFELSAPIPHGDPTANLAQIRDLADRMAKLGATHMRLSADEDTLWMDGWKERPPIEKPRFDPPAPPS